jgi:hypothetical protein
MGGNKVTRKRLWRWRWRDNPLRRRDDIREAWVLLLTWAVVIVGSLAAGLVTAHAANEVFAEERAQRHPVQAVVLTGAPRSTSSSRSMSYRTVERVRWTGSDGVTRTGHALVRAGLPTGSAVTVWQDERGALTTKPIGPTESAIEAGLFGTAAAVALSGLVFGTGALARWRLDRRRLEQWDSEWALFGPRWDQKTG